MTVVAGISLAITEDVQDKSTAALRALRGELKATSAQADAVTAGSARQASVTAALTDKINSASRAKEAFNKVLGLGGFVGIIAAAAAGVVNFVSELTGYQEGIRRSDEVTADFIKRLGELKDARLEFDKRTSADRQREQIDAAVKLNELQVKLNAQTTDRLTKEQALKELIEEQNLAFRVSNSSKLLGNVLSEQDQKRREKIRQLGDQINDSLRTEKASMATVSDLAYRAGPAFSDMARYARELPASFALASGNLSALFEIALKVGKQAPKPPGGGGGGSDGSAERIRGLERELALGRAININDQSAVRIAAIRDDLDHKRISAREAELRITIEREKTISAIKADREKKEKEFDDHAKKRADDLAKAQGKDSKKDEKDIERERADALTARGKAVERVGNAAAAAADKIAQFDSHLAGLSETVSQTTTIWANYESGQSSLGNTVADTIGVLGAGIASAIKDKRTQAGVEGGFEAAASIASFASANIPAGIAHAAAATAFFAVAAGAGNGGASKAGGGGSAAASSSVSPSSQASSGSGFGSSRGNPDKREVIIVQFGSGIVYGLGSDVAKAAAGAGETLRNTGMGRRRF